MRPNTIKEKIRAGQPVFGAFVNFPSPTVVEICGLAGFDFVIIDAEHGPMTPQSCEEMVRAAECVGIVPIIRVAQNVPQVILRYLDIGALGVQLPMVNSRAEAEAAVRAVKYYPEGRRGLASVRAAGYGLTQPLSEYVVEANRQTMLITHVETMEAVQNLPEILQVPGIDVVFIGPTDLSQAMGYPGRPQEPVVQETIDRLIRDIRAAGKAVGTIARDGEQARRFLEKGVTYLATGASGLLGQAVRQYLKQARG